MSKLDPTKSIFTLPAQTKHVSKQDFYIKQAKQTLCWMLKCLKANTLTERLSERSLPIFDEIKSKTIQEEDDGD